MPSPCQPKPLPEIGTIGFAVFLLKNEKSADLRLAAVCVDAVRVDAIETNRRMIGVVSIGSDAAVWVDESQFFTSRRECLYESLWLLRGVIVSVFRAIKTERRACR